MKYFIIIVLMNFSSILYCDAQGIEKKILNSVLEEILLNNHLYSMDSLFEIIIDEYGEYKVSFITDEISFEEKEFFNNLNNNAFTNYIVTQKTNLFPLKDTIIIIDTTGFFSPTKLFKENFSMEVLVDKEKIYAVKKSITLNDYVFRDDFLILSFTNDKHFNGSINFYINLNDKIAITKMR